MDTAKVKACVRFLLSYSFWVKQISWEQFEQASYMISMLCSSTQNALLPLVTMSIPYPELAAQASPWYVIPFSVYLDDFLQFFTNVCCISFIWLQRSFCRLYRYTVSQMQALQNILLQGKEFSSTHVVLFWVNLWEPNRRERCFPSISFTEKWKWEWYLITPTLPSLKESWRTFNLASCLSAFDTDINRSDNIFILCTKQGKKMAVYQTHQPTKHLLLIKYKESRN